MSLNVKISRSRNHLLHKLGSTVQSTFPKRIRPSTSGSYLNKIRDDVGRGRKKIHKCDGVEALISSN